MADHKNILQSLIYFLHEDTAVEAIGITDSTTIGDLGLDSVDFVGILMRIEARFRVRLPRAELAAVETVGDLISLVERKQASPQVKAAAA